MRCRFCREPAGFLQSVHDECEDRNGAAPERVIELLRDAATGGQSWEEVRPQVEAVMEWGFLPSRGLPSLIGKGLRAAEQVVLDDHLLDENEERNMNRFLDSLEAAGQDGASEPEVRDRLRNAKVVRLVMDGENPMVSLGRTVRARLNFMKSESPVWEFDDVAYEVSRTRTRYVGGSRGASFRVAKGVYVRTGSFRGSRITEEEREIVDTGSLVVTTKHVYFSGSERRFRVRHDRVVSYEPLADGFELTRDRVNARPERFHTGDGWFVLNLLMHAQDLP